MVDKTCFGTSNRDLLGRACPPHHPRRNHERAARHSYGHLGELTVRLGAITAVILAALVVASCGGGGGPAPSTLPVLRVAEIPLTGGNTRFDYQSIDPTRHLLAIAHLGANQVILVDLTNSTVSATVGDVQDVRGVLAVPELGRIYASATGSHELVAIDADTHAILRRTRIGSFPDGIAYDPASHRLFVSDGDAVTVVDAGTNAPAGRVSLPGGVGNVQLDTTSGHIFANHQGGSTLVEIDPASLDVTRRIGLTGCGGNHGLLIDAGSDRAFVACEDNATLVIVDLATGKQIGRLPTGDQPDVLAGDAALHRLYVASESGTLSVYATDRAAVREIAHAKLADNAHSVAVDPTTHLIYLPLPDGGRGEPALWIMKPR